MPCTTPGWYRPNDTAAAGVLSARALVSIFEASRDRWVALQSSHKLFKVRSVYRLGEMQIESRFRGPALVFLLAPSRESHENQLVAPALLADASSRIVAVEFWHADVQQHHVGPESCSFFDGLKAIANRAYFIAHQAQHHAHALYCIVVVVRDQNAIARLGRRIGAQVLRA